MKAVRAVRIWKRDNTKNIMFLDSAVANLKVNAIPPFIREWTPAKIGETLLTGGVIETPRAYFRAFGVAEFRSYFNVKNDLQAEVC